ncbi:hypothetical protein ACFCYM_29385 [Streptomyces sp. NPDC056254]|uniref:hypothetical protein n=1 Tax=Streptomyces sp. NPDC056254 TaxID=3345763 RepID=UPI0035DCE44E
MTSHLPTADGRTYPAELIRAITLTWLFAGQRSEEVTRLRVGCIRWQHDGMPIPGDSGEVLACDAVCLLDIPTDKTGTALTKPVDPLLGQAIEAWRAVRPEQPALLDHKTNERADFLPRPPGLQAIHKRDDHPDALPQGRRPHRRRPRQHHQPPGPLDHRQPGCTLRAFAASGAPPPSSQASRVSSRRSLWREVRPASGRRH